MASLKKPGIKVIKQINTKPTINKFNKNILKQDIRKLATISKFDIT